jgi:thioredoxin-related protein
MRYFLFLFVVVSLPFNAHASDELQRKDLSQLAVLAIHEKLPILLIVSQHDCPFCVRLREEVILPMQANGEDKGRVLIAEIFMDSPENVLDLQGIPLLPAEIANAYKVWVTPTLLFLDSSGREIHKRMLGVNTIELYGHYLDESLAAALTAVRIGDRSYVPTNKDILGDAPGADLVN